jgi:hypothetical protein
MKKTFFLLLVLLLPVAVKAQKPLITLSGTHVSTCDLESDSTYGEWADWTEYYTEILIDEENSWIDISGSEEKSYEILERLDDTVEDDVTYVTFNCLDDDFAYYEIQILVFKLDDGSQEIQELHVYGEEGGRAYKVERIE